MPWPFTPISVPVLTNETELASPSCSTRLAFQLFRQLSSSADSSNLFFSPSSAMLCMALVHELASGETRQGIGRVLEIAGLDAAKIEAEIALLKSALREQSNVEVTFVNSLWLGKHAKIAPELVARLRALYESELTSVRFRRPGSNSHHQREGQNAWVNRRTRGKIGGSWINFRRSRLWSPVNAVYFKALWVDPFHSEFTRDDSFTTATGRTKQLPMMSQSGTYRYCEDAQSQMVAHTRVDTRCTWCSPLREPIGSDFR
jgi:serine protease inhibitor